MKRSFLILGIVFTITLAFIFGTRVSADALAVIVGVILGILAGIPTTALVIFMLSRQRQGLNLGSSAQTTSQPPVIVINATDRASLTSPSPPALSLPYPTEPTRKWTVIGDSETES